MDKLPILLVDDDFDSRELLARQLQSGGYRVVRASGASEALAIFRSEPLPIVLTDLHMPDRSGFELLKELKKFTNPPVVLVTTVESEAETAISIMKEGAFDYLVKPIREKELLFRVFKAQEYFELLRASKAVEADRETRLEYRLNSNIWKEAIASRNADRYDRTLFENLRVCFTQGAGFGGMVALAEVMAALARKENDHYLIPEAMMDQFFSNAQTARRALDDFSDLNDVLNQEVPLQRISLRDFFESLTAIENEIEPLVALKGHHLLRSSEIFPEPGFLKIHLEYFKRAYREIILNALKFSEANSDILILFQSKAGKFLISVINKPEQENDFKAAGFEKIIFEPFFRISKVVDERYGTLDYGLGLTFVDKIIRSHSGRISATGVQYHLEEKDAGGRRFHLEIELPLDLA